MLSSSFRRLDDDRFLLPLSNPSTVQRLALFIFFPCQVSFHDIKYPVSISDSTKSTSLIEIWKHQDLLVVGWGFGSEEERRGSKTKGRQAGMDDSAEEKENCVTNGEENVRQEVIVARDERSQLRKGDGRSALTKELIQAESKHFDVGAITLLRVSGRGLTNIGQDIAMCHSIVEVDLSENKIDCVDGLEWLKALRKVVLSKNNLSNLGTTL